MTLKIPVFLSAPTSLNECQQCNYEYIVKCLKQENLEGRALGRTDFPHENPLAEVYYIARSCFGGIIAGFVQATADNAILKPGTDSKTSIDRHYAPTPWNHLEAGMLFCLVKPLIVVKERGVSGGIFDRGTSKYFVIELACDTPRVSNPDAIREGIRAWAADVRNHYRAA